MKAPLLIGILAVAALGVLWMIVQPDSQAAEPHTTKQPGPSPVVVAAAEQASAEIERILGAADSDPAASVPEQSAVPSPAGSSSNKAGPLQPSEKAPFTDYDFVADVARTPRFVDVDQTTSSRQLNPREQAVPGWVVKKVNDDVTDAQRKVNELVNQLGAVRGAEMDDLMKKGELRPLDRTLAPALYDATLAAARRTYMRDNPELVKLPGWEGDKQFQWSLKGQLVNALALRTDFTQAIYGSDGRVFVARVADLPKFHQFLKEGALEVVATDLCMRVLDHFKVAGLLNEKERDELWARFSTLLGDKMQKLSR